MPRSFRIGDWLVRPHQNELVGPSRRVKVQPRVMELLLYLAEHPGKIVSREQIFEVIWRGDFVSDEVLTVAVSELRKALGDDPKSPHFIQTYPKRGYRLLLTPVSSAEVVPAGVAKSRLSRNQRWALGIAAGAFLAALLSSYAWRADRPLEEIRLESVRSLAVLPLRNLSGDPEQEYFADGMTEALTTDLATIRGLKVISRASSMHYKGTDESLAKIARALNVDALVEGSVLRVGSRVRITARLIHSETGQHLWSARYERELSDVLALQSEIARTIAGELRVTLTPLEKARLTDSPAVDPEANEATLKGFFYCGKSTPEGLDTGIEFSERAIEKAPHYALAYSSLAYCYNNLTYFTDHPPAEVFPKAKAAATQALKLDDTLADAHVQLAFAIDSYDWDWAGAETEYRRAIELNPSSSFARRVYGLFLVTMGRYDEGIAEARRAQDLDPLSLGTRTNVGLVLYFARRHDEATAHLLETIEMEPNYWFAHFLLGMVYTTKGMYQEAIEAHQKALTLSGGDPQTKALLGYVYGVSGRSNEARKIAAELEELSSRRYVPPTTLSLVYQGLGQIDQAFQWGQRAYEVRDGNMGGIKVHPLLDALRPDPRFQDIMRRMNFPDSTAERR